MVPRNDGAGVKDAGCREHSWTYTAGRDAGWSSSALDGRGGRAIRAASTATGQSGRVVRVRGWTAGQQRSPTAAPRRRQPGRDAGHRRGGGCGGGRGGRRGCRDHRQPPVSAAGVGGVCRQPAAAGTQSRASSGPLKRGQIGEGLRSLQQDEVLPPPADELADHHTRVDTSQFPSSTNRTPL